MFGYIFATLAMLTGLVGMIIFGKKRQKDELTVPVSAAFFLLLMIGAITFFAKAMGTGGEMEQKADYALAYSRISALILGQHLAGIAPGAQALVIVDDNRSEDIHLKARLEGLKEGFGKTVTIAAIDSPSQDAPTATEKPMSPERRIHLRKKSMASQFDDLLMEHPECNLVVSMVGLPQNPDEMAVWNKPPETRPKFALLRCDIRNYQGAILAGAICAAVIARPTTEPDMARPNKDPQAAFDQQFLLITPENAAQMAEQYGIFTQ
jgi:hypothetical protein